MGEDLNSLEAQLTQLPEERILAESEQLRHWFEAAPEQVEQSEWQAEQAEAEDL